MFLRFVKIEDGSFNVIAGKLVIGRILDFRYNLGRVEWSIDFFKISYCGTSLTIKDCKREVKHRWFSILNDLNLTWKETK